MASRALPGLGLNAFWGLGEDGWKTGMDANLLALSTLVQGSVISATTSLPGSPADGDRYIVPHADAHGDSVAVRDAGAWVYLTPHIGWRIYAEDIAAHKTFTAAGWVTDAVGGGGSTAIGAHAYWMILMAGASPFAIAELAMAATAGGANQCSGGTGFASTIYSAGYEASLAFNGNASDFWNSASFDSGCYIGYHFPAAVSVAEMRITARNDSYSNQSPHAFQVFYSDDGVSYRSAGFAMSSAVYAAGDTQTFAVPT